MKKICLILSLFVLATQSTLALAPSFSDVPSDAWYRPYVDQLRDEGIVDAGEFFRPEDGLNRAELVKMIITTIDGLEDYTPPPNPTFDDVLPGEWYTNYIEQAATLGIVTGYSDAQGNLIGLFGPGDTVNRAAATKMLIKAFDISLDTQPHSLFPDVMTSDWFHDYVLTAYNQSILDGYENGYFGPHDSVTRAQIAKLIINAKNPSERPEECCRETSQPPEPEDEVVEEEPAEEAEEPSGPLAEANPASIEEINIPAGNNEVFVAKYTFNALYEGFNVETVTVVNDITGDQLGDQPESTTAVKNVILKFPNEAGELVTVSRSLGSDGKARFANLEFFAPRDEEAFFEIYAELNKVSDVGEALSGEVFRLGLQDANNDNDSFRAVGDISGFVIGYNGSRLSVSNAQVEPMTVRKTVPVFGINETSDTLTSGENTLISFDITANEAGSVGLARLVFELNVYDSAGADLSLSDFRLFRGSTYMSGVNIYDATGAQDVSLGSGAGIMNGASYVIVSFDQEETIGKGETKTYSLRAGAGNAGSNDSVSTRIAQGDEETALSGLTAVNQPNTGKVYVNGDATAGIFTGVNDFAQTLGTAHNIIWSDKSADSHLYPGISGGVVTSDSGSADWTNGYQLDITALTDHVISN